MAIRIVLQSIMVSLPISIITDRIIAMDTIFMVSKKADINLDFLSLGIRGFKKATNKNEGRKIPRVAAAAPPIPLICQPINVAEEKTGPGVN